MFPFAVISFFSIVSTLSVSYAATCFTPSLACAIAKLYGTDFSMAISLYSSPNTIHSSGTAWVDFIPFDTNKAKGVEKYQEILGIRPEECIVFGDEYNDIAML